MNVHTDKINETSQTQQRTPGVGRPRSKLSKPSSHRGPGDGKAGSGASRLNALAVSPLSKRRGLAHQPNISSKPRADALTCSAASHLAAEAYAPIMALATVLLGAIPARLISPHTRSASSHMAHLAHVLMSAPYVTTLGTTPSSCVRGGGGARCKTC